MVCVDPRHHVEALDPDLAGLVRPETRVVKVGAIPVGWTRPFGLVGEIGLRALPQLRSSIARCIAERRPNVVMLTGSPFYPLLLSGWIRRRWGIPVVIDMQDPWVSREGSTRPRWTKGWLAHRLAVMLEPRAVRGASWITSVSEGQNREMAERYPWLDAARMSAIPIGGDPEDFTALSRETEARPAGEQITFSYVGTALPRSAPLLEVLFSGLRLLRESQPDLAERIAFRFVGTSNQPGGGGAPRVLPFAQAAGVADLVSEHPGRVPFLEALRTLATSDATLMIGSDEPHYTASKIYPCLMANRPHLSLFHAESSAHHILTAAGGGVPLAFRSAEELAALAPAIRDALARIAAAPQSLGAIDPDAYRDFTAHAVAGTYAGLFERLVAERAA